MESKEERTILSSNATLTLMVILAEGFARLRSTKIADRALAEISSHSRELVAHIADVAIMFGTINQLGAS